MWPQEVDEVTLVWRIAASVTCLAAICGVAILWPVHKKKAIERKLAETASVYRVRAEHGDAKAQYRLAVSYAQGEGVPRDYVEAVRWYRKAAEQGDANAQLGLGYMYDHGQGVPQDYVEAVRWYRKAAEQGDANAQNGLGYMYNHGQGVPQDYVEAVRWCRKAAEQGDAMAQSYLGFSYFKGQGVPQDYAEAVRWYRKAAEQGDAKAQYGLGFMYREGQGVQRDDAEAVRWYRKAADQGDAMAQRALGFTKTGWNVGRKMRYLSFLIVFLGGLWFSIDFLLPGRSLRDWRQKARTLFGISGMLWAGLSVYGLVHMEIRYSVCANAFYLAKGLLAGMSIAILICLSLTAKKNRRKTEPQ
jgi:TPR repeat protein